MYPLEKFRKTAQKNLSENENFCRKITTLQIITPTQKSLFNDLVKKHWDGFDCTTCGNCCREISPFFTTSELKILAKALDKDFNFVRKEYFKASADREGFIPLLKPCPFFFNNRCTVYEYRPAGCKDFPHCNELLSYAMLHVESTLVCPVVFNIIDSLRQKWPC